LITEAGMSIRGAKQFILACRNDTGFRTKVNGCATPEEAEHLLSGPDGSFTNADVSLAFAELRAHAQDEDELDELAELNMWYEMLTGKECADPRSACYTCSAGTSCASPH